MARNSRKPGTFTNLQKTLDVRFFPALSMVAISTRVMDLAYPLAIRTNVASRLDTRCPTHNISGDRASFLVAGREPDCCSRLWRFSRLCLHDNTAYQRAGGVAHICAAGLVRVLRSDCSKVASQCTRRSTDRRTHHVDSRWDTSAHCRSRFAC